MILDSESPRPCTDGFPDLTVNKRLRVPANFNSTILIPDMKFTCSGTVDVVQVIVAGRPQRNGNQNTGNMKLQIWRENATERGRYNKLEDIVLPSMCKGNRLKKVEMFRAMYECMLRMNVHISVEPGDILGIDLPPRDIAYFNLSFIKSKSTIYSFQPNLSSTIDLCSRINEASLRPLIKIEVVPGTLL